MMSHVVGERLLKTLLQKSNPLAPRQRNKETRILGPHLTSDDIEHRMTLDDIGRVQGLCPNGIRRGQGGSSISAWPSLEAKVNFWILVDFGLFFLAQLDTNSIPICRVWAFPSFSSCRRFIMLYSTSLSRWTAAFFSRPLQRGWAKVRPRSLSHRSRVRHNLQIPRCLMASDRCPKKGCVSKN